MSYELSGLGAAPTPHAKKIHKLKGSKLPHPTARTGLKRRTPPHEITRTLPRVPAWAVESSQLTGLGFSLKPPKWVRKLTIKKVLKPLAITAAVITGAALIPGALPLLARGVLGAGKLAAKGVVGGGRLIGRSFSSAFTALISKKAPAQGAQTQSEYDAEQAAANAAAQAAANQAAANAQAAANQAAQDAANQAAANQAQYPPPTYTPSDSGGGGWSAGGGGGGYSSPAATATEAPAQAGMDTSSLIPIGVGLVALIAVSGALKRQRK